MAIVLAGRAYLAMLGAVTIYGTNFAISRHAVLNGLEPMDMTALRFGVAGLLLLPLLLKPGFADCWGIGWKRAALLTVISGFPMTLFMMVGLTLAPASHASSIAPGTVTLIGAIGGWIVFGNRLTPQGMAGVAVVLAGLFAIGIAGSAASGASVLLGDLCFLAVGLLWGSYPLLMQKWKLDPLLTTAVMSVLSAVCFTPVYAAMGGFGRLAAAPLDAVLFHGLNQGVLNMVVGLWLWGWAARTIGATVSGRFPPLIPVIGTLTAIPLLGEWPGPVQVAGIALIVFGLLLMASRAPAG
jgi:drug/metabolite transporter (DMT)-like permease